MNWQAILALVVILTMGFLWVRISLRRFNKKIQEALIEINNTMDEESKVRAFCMRIKHVDKAAILGWLLGGRWADKFVLLADDADLLVRVQVAAMADRAVMVLGEKMEVRVPESNTPSPAEFREFILGNAVALLIFE